MNKEFLLTFILFFSLSLTIFSQDSLYIEKSYGTYFTAPRESIFMHLNKTNFISGEDIWFKIYAYDRKNQLMSKATTNINVGIYDENGKEIIKKLFLARNGFSKGNFSLDSTFSGGNYFIKAETNWMKNFHESDAFVQKIKIIESNLESKTSVSKNFDFQLLAEGGQLLANANNILAYKMIDENGKGTFTTGAVLNENGEEIVSFKSNFLGIGKFTFKPEIGKNYKVKLSSENIDTIINSFPNIKSKGLNLSVNNLLDNKLIISFSTNPESLPILGNKNYKVLIHKDGKTKSFNFSFKNKLKTILPISKTNLFHGINIITVFDEENNPILERMIFNNSKINYEKLKINKAKITNDSIFYEVNATDISNVINLSLSVLPQKTKGYKNTNTIISSFYLKPYIKSNVENPLYYFKDNSRKTSYNLDLLLLTQGWSRYSWDRIFNLPPKISFDFENGLTISGNLNKSKDKKFESILLQPTRNHDSRFINLDKDGKFSITNFYPYLGEEIVISGVDDKGKFKKPSMYINYTNINYRAPRISNNDISNNYYLNSDKNISDKVYFLSDLLYTERELLDEVVVSARKKDKIDDDELSVTANVTKITEEVYNKYFNITDFIQNNGYDVFIGDGFVAKLGSVSITNRRVGSFSGVLTPLIFLDGAQVTDFSILSSISTANVEKISVDKTGFGYGLRGSGGVIKIYTRRTSLFNTATFSKTNSFSSKVTIGFEEPKDFYMPKYKDFSSNAFEKLGIIHWEPNIEIKNGKATFKTTNTQTDGIVIFLEGISEDGKLFTDKIEIK